MFGMPEEDMSNETAIRQFIHSAYLNLIETFFKKLKRNKVPEKIKFNGKFNVHVFEWFHFINITNNDRPFGLFDL